MRKTGRLPILSERGPQKSGPVVDAKKSERRDEKMRNGEGVSTFATREYPLLSLSLSLFWRSTKVNF